MPFSLTPEQKTLYLPCGGTAIFDPESGTNSFRCEDCGAVVGSIGQPKECRDAAEAYEKWAVLGGMKWDYMTGKPSENPTKFSYKVKSY